MSLEENSLSNKEKDTLSAVTTLGGRASADEVSKITDQKSSDESYNLRELWEKRLLTRNREGRIVFYSIPERALVDILKQTDKIPMHNLIVELSKQIYHNERSHIIVEDIVCSMIESAIINKVVKYEKGIMSLNNNLHIVRVEAMTLE